MSLSASDLKKAACDAIDAAAQDLNDISQEIWKHPELNYEEHHAHKVLTEFLERRGFPVERHYVVDTGFRAVVDHGDGAGPTAAVLCEYDALPGIGHACGHNLIAEVGVGAAVGIKAAMDVAQKTGQKLGQLHVIGTPAEEGGGGKILMINAGTFQKVDFAMMCHPTPSTIINCDRFIICRLQGRIKFHGKASHAAAFPWEGVNALDAAVMAYNNISVLRQQIKPTWRIHGVITNGGAKPNIIPEVTEMLYYIRAPTKKDMDVVQGKVTQCFNAAAEATGCRVDVTWEDMVYLNMITSKQLEESFKGNALALGVKLTDEADIPPQLGSTDMGNVSYEVPSLHPFYNMGGDAANHTREFTVEAGAAKAQPYTLAQAKALAMTVIDMYCNPDLVAKMKEQLRVEVD